MMKFVAVAGAVFALLSVGPAHAEDFDFLWQSQRWTKTFESPTQSFVSGPFTLSGQGNATFAEMASGGVALRFDGSYGGTLIASGDGTFNGPMTFPTSDNTTGKGLGVLTPTADGFSVVVHHAASGPDPGAAFFGNGTRAGNGARVGIAASEPVTLALTMAGLTAAAFAASRRRSTR
jgi:hypothetical protein